MSKDLNKLFFLVEDKKLIGEMSLLCLLEELHQNTVPIELKDLSAGKAAFCTFYNDKKPQTVIRVR